MQILTEPEAGNAAKVLGPLDVYLATDLVRPVRPKQIPRRENVTATVNVLCLLAPDTSAKIHETFADIQDSQDGADAQLLVITR